jgi:hypothetical protein
MSILVLPGFRRILDPILCKLLATIGKILKLATPQLSTVYTEDKGDSVDEIGLACAIGPMTKVKLRKGPIVR